MANFDDVAIEAADRLSTVMERTNDTRQNLSDMSDRLTDLQQQLQENQSGFESALQTLHQRVAFLRAELSQQSATNQQAIEHLQAVTSQYESDMTQRQAAYDSAMSAVGEQLETWHEELESTLQQQTDAIAPLPETLASVPEEVSTAADGAIEPLQSGLISTLQEGQSALADLAGELESEAGGETVTALVDAGAEFEQHFEAIAEDLASAAGGVLDDTQSAVESLVQELLDVFEGCQSGLQEERESFGQLAERLGSVFEQDALDRMSESLNEGLVQRFQQNCEKANQAVTLMGDFTEKLESF